MQLGLQVELAMEKVGIFGVILVALVVLWPSNDTQPPSKTEQRIRSVLNYLERSPEVAWIECDETTVYVGFRSKRTRPPWTGTQAILEAARRASREVGQPVTIYALDSATMSPEWRPTYGEGFPLGVVTYRSLRDYSVSGNF